MYAPVQLAVMITIITEHYSTHAGLLCARATHANDVNFNSFYITITGPGRRPLGNYL